MFGAYVRPAFNMQLFLLLLIYISHAGATSLNCEARTRDCGDGGGAAVRLSITDDGTNYNFALHDGCLFATTAPNSRAGRGWYTDFSFQVAKSNCTALGAAGLNCTVNAVAVHNPAPQEHTGGDFIAGNFNFALQVAGGTGVLADELQYTAKWSGQGFYQGGEQLFFVNMVPPTPSVPTECHLN